MTQDLSQTTIMLTGASRGLGRAMALSLARHGASLCLCATSRGPALTETEQACRASGAGKVFATAFDIADFSACTEAVQDAEAELGPLTALVNNAGLGMRRVSESFNRIATKFWETDPAAWREIIDINVNGTFNLSRAVAPGMVARGAGKIVNISTSAQTMVRRGYAPYGPSKAAIEAASRIWAQDMEGTGVTVNVFLPGGAADTDLLPPGPDKKGADGNLLSPEVMARGILWLCGPGSDGHSGQRYIGRYWGDGPAPAPKAISPNTSVPAIM